MEESVLWDHTYSRPMMHECGCCGRELRTAMGLKEHMKRHRGMKDYTCYTCDRLFLTSSDLLCHCVVNHGLTTHHYCRLCKSYWITADMYRQHLKTHDQEKRVYRCVTCKRVFTSWRMFRLHKAQHGPTRPVPQYTHGPTRPVPQYSCLVCHSFNFSPMVLHQINMFSRKKQPRCGFCDVSYMGKAELYEIVRRHDKMWPYKCKACDTGFITKIGMTMHLATHHSGERRRIKRSKTVRFPRKMIENMFERDFKTGRKICCNQNENILKRSEFIFKQKKARLQKRKEKTRTKSSGVITETKHSTDHKITRQNNKCSVDGSSKSTIQGNAQSKQVKSSGGVCTQTKHSPKGTDCNEMTTSTLLTSLIERFTRNNSTRHSARNAQTNSEDIGSVSDDTASKNSSKDGISVNDEEAISKRKAHVKKVVKWNQLRKIADMPYKCLDCAVSYGDEAKLEKHMLNYHTVRSRMLICHVCGKTNFSDKIQFEDHVALHNGEVHNRCDVCDKVFDTRYGLKVHKRRHMKKFECEFCGRKFALERDLRKHTNMHTKQAEFACSQCGKVFYLKKYVLRHEQTHKADYVPYARRRLNKPGTKPYKKKKVPCEVCGKECVSRYSYNNHMRTHTGEKPYVCEVCGAAFKQDTGLKYHTRVKCGGKKFKTKNSIP